MALNCERDRYVYDYERYSKTFKSFEGRSYFEFVQEEDTTEHDLAIILMYKVRHFIIIWSDLAAIINDCVLLATRRFERKTVQRRIQKPDTIL